MSDRILGLFLILLTLWLGMAVAGAVLVATTHT